MTKLIDIACEVKGETANAYRLFDGKTTAWLPKSQIEVHQEGKNVVAVMPIWLAKERGFL